MFLAERQVMTATAGTLTLIVDSTSVAAGERALDSIARTGSRVEGSLKIDMGQIEQAMERLGQKVIRLDATMTAGMGRVSAAGQAQAKTFEALRASIDPAFAASQRFRQVQQELAGMVQRGEASQRAANLVLEQAASRYLGAATAAERKSEAERKASLVTAEAAKNYEILRASVDPLYATSRRYEAALMALDTAQAAGVISDRDRIQTLSLLEAQMIQTKGSAAGAAGGVANFGMIATQVGYQIQDVFVSAPMVGWLRAITQQAPQAAGAFAMLGGTLGAIIPWVGTAVAVGAALTPMLFDMGDGAEEASGELDELAQFIDRLSAVSQATSGDLDRYLITAFGEVSSQVQALIEDLKRAEFSAISAKMQREVESASRLLTQLEGAWDVFTESLKDGAQVDQAYLDRQVEIIRKSKLELGDFLAIQKEVKDVFAATTVDQFVKELAEAYALADGLGGPVGKQVVEALLKAAQEGGVLDRVLASAATSAGSIKSDANAAADAFLRAANNAMAMQQSMASLSMPFKDAMEELDFELSTKAMSAADKLVATRVRRLEETMRSASERVFGFDYGLTDEQKAQLAEFEAALKKQAGQLVKVSAAGARAEKQLKRELDAVRASLSPLGAYNQKLEELVALKGLLSDQEMAQAIRNLNVELADSLPLVGDLTDAVVEGLFNGFKGTLDDIGGLFKRWLIELIAMAAKNQIVISMGLGGVAAGTPAAAAGSVGSSVLGVGNLLGGIGGSLLSGAFNSVGALFTGGFSSMFSTIGGQFATAFASGTASSIAASIGAVLGPVALLGAALTAIIGTVKTLDVGIQVTVDEFDTLVETYRLRRKSYLFGLVSSRSTVMNSADAAVADPIIDAVAQIQASVLNMSDILGIGAEAFDGFSTVVRISTMDMTDEEIAAEVQAQLTAVADAMAEMALEGFEVFRSGESASEALARLSSSLVAVTQVSDLLGHSFTGTGVLGAALASSLVDAFGGLDAYTHATRSYFEAFFSEEERRAAILSQTSAALAQINVVMPETRQQYRAMVDALDLTTERGRELYATLISMADVMDFVLPSVQGFTDIISALVGSTGSVVDQMLSEGASMARAAETAASNWYKASETIKDLISDILNSNTTGPAGRDQSLRYNLSQYETALSAARGGDIDAARSIPSLASAYLDSVKGTASSFAEFQAAQARVLGDARFLSGIAELEGANQDVLVSLYQEQIGILEEVRDYLATTETISADDISSFEARLGSLQAAIEEAELFSYDYLRERLQVTVDLLPTANLPEDVRALIRAATTGIESSINFAVFAADLTPDLRWLAVNGASEHIKTIEFVVGDSQWSQAAQDVALGSAGTFVQTVQFVARNLMSAGMTEIALTDASALIKTIRFSAQAIPADLRALIFNDIEALDKTINFLEGDSIPDDKQALALEDASTFRRIINIVAGNIAGERIQKLALDDPLAFRRVINITAGTIPDISVRRLALDAAAEFTRVINLEPGATLDANTVRLALMTSGSVTRTIRAVMSNGLTHDEMLLALAGSSELARVVNVSLASGADPVAIQLALGNIGAYAVNIRAALQASAEVREIVFGDAGSYAAMIEAAFSADLSDEARRVLLEQQGEYAVNIIATLSADMPDNVRTLLLNANTSAIRGITIATAFAGSVDPDELPLLLEDSTAVLRMISIAVNPIGITAFDMLFMDVLASGQTETWRGIRAGVDTSGISGRSLVYLQELGSDAFWRWRGIRGGVDLGGMGSTGWRYFNELSSNAFWRNRGIRGDVDLHQLSSAGWRFFNELSSNSFWRWRGIRGSVDLTGLTGNGLRFFNELSTRVSTIQRIIDGEVDLSGLTARQLSLIDLIRGTTTGTVTLGGSFVFDPSASFTTWWESATETQITTPMSVLTEALADLRAAADANTAALEQARIDNYIAGLTVNNRGQSFMNEEQIRTLSDMMGIDQTGASLGQLMWRIANASRTDALERVFYDPTGASENRFRAGTSWDYRSGYTRDDFSIVSDPDNPWSYSITGPQGGTQTGLTYDQVYALMDGVILGDVPAFATGGSHAGGLRLVGEQGVELEATGPSRIYSARQTQALLAGAGADVVDQIARLTDELKELRKENVQLQSKIYGVTRDTAKRLEKFDKDGLPAERV